MVGEDSLYFDKTVSFADLGLERRLTKALGNQKFLFPSNVQAQAIPVILQKKDVLMRAKTGSGKTLAYLLPLIQLLLQGCQEAEAGIKAVILVPSNELVHQVWKTVKKEVIKFCGDVLSVLSLRADRGMKTQAARLKEGPNIVVSTPTRLAKHLKKTGVKLDALQHLVVDEADLILSFGYFDDVQTVVSSLPKSYHCVLVSATLTTNLSELQKLVITDPDPTVVSVTDGMNDDEELLQEFHLKVENKQMKLLVLFTLIKLELLKGKMLVFTNTLNRCYELKLFLEQFAISSAVFNHTLPSNCRQSILNHFNQGIFDLLIVTDDGLNVDKEFMLMPEVEETAEPQEEALTGQRREKGDPGDEAEQQEEASLEEGDEAEQQEQVSPKPSSEGLDKVEQKEEATPEQSFEGGDKGEERKTEAKSEQKDEATSKKRERPPPKNPKLKRAKTTTTASRGIDFREVTAVVNFDFPNSVKTYTHRVGRTARGGRYGTALSIWTPYDNDVMRGLQEFQMANSPHHKATIQPLDFDLSEVVGFKTRVEIATANVTHSAIKQARLDELKLQLLNSTKLQTHFEDNPREANLLRHDHKLRKKPVDKLLAHIPSYILGEKTIVEVPNSTRNFQALGASSEVPGRRKRKWKKKKRGDPLRKKRRRRK